MILDIEHRILPTDDLKLFETYVCSSYSLFLCMIVNLCGIFVGKKNPIAYIIKAANCIQKAYIHIAF